MSMHDPSVTLRTFHVSKLETKTTWHIENDFKLDLIEIRVTIEQDIKLSDLEK